MSAAIPKVTVFAFGPLGSSIVSALNSPQYAAHFATTVALQPSAWDVKDGLTAAKMAKYKAMNVPMLPVDVDKASHEELVRLVLGSDVVISTMGFRHRESVTTPDHKILAAVKTAKVPFFVPNIFSSDVYAIERMDINPLLKLKSQLIRDVQASGVNHIIFINGVFMEFLISPFGGVDFDNMTITAPGSFDSKITATSINDAGNLVAEALLQRHQPYVKNQVLRLGSDTFTWSDMHAALEQRFKKPFKKQVMSKGDLEKLLSADVSKHNLFVRFQLLWAEQKGISWDLSHGFHQDHANHVKMTKMREYVLSMKEELLAFIKEQDTAEHQ